MLCNRQQLPNQSVLLGPVSATRGVPYGIKTQCWQDIHIHGLVICQVEPFIAGFKYVLCQGGGQGVCYVGYA